MVYGIMSINKIFLYTSSILLVLFIIFWLLLYSNHTANNTEVIKLRNSFFSLLDQITPQKLFIYKVRPISSDSNGYVYKFPGKFQEIDFLNSTITLKDLRGKSWKFKYSVNKREDGIETDYQSVDYRYLLQRKTKESTSSLQKIQINRVNPSDSISHFSKNDILVLYWRDTKTMLELFNYRKNGGVIELKGAELIQINKVVWE